MNTFAPAKYNNSFTKLAKRQIARILIVNFYLFVPCIQLFYGLSHFKCKQATGQVFACPVPVFFLYFLICLSAKTKLPCGAALTARPACSPYTCGTAARCPKYRPPAALPPPLKGAYRKPAAAAPPVPLSGLPPIARTTRWLAVSLF